jgi:hypothetical protein
MAEAKTPVTIARAFTRAWTNGAADEAATYVADDVVFDGPLGHVKGKSAYMESLRGLVRNLGVTGVEVVADFGDATQALIMYKLLTSQYGALLCAKLLTVQDGLIQRDLLTFDSYPIRKA